MSTIQRIRNIGQQCLGRTYHERVRYKITNSSFNPVYFFLKMLFFLVIHVIQDLGALLSLILILTLSLSLFRIHGHFYILKNFTPYQVLLFDSLFANFLLVSSICMSIILHMHAHA